MYRPERPKGAKDKVKRPFLPFLPILHCRGAKPAGAKPAAATQQHPRQSIADQGRLQQTKADHGRPKHSEIRGATSNSDAFILWKVSLSNEDSLTQVSAHMNNIKLLIERTTPLTTISACVVCNLLLWCGVVLWIVHDKQLSLNRSSFSKRLLMLVQWWLLCEKYPPLMRTALLKCSHE